MVAFGRGALAFDALAMRKLRPCEILLTNDDGIRMRPASSSLS